MLTSSIFKTWLILNISLRGVIKSLHLLTSKQPLSLKESPKNKFILVLKELVFLFIKVPLWQFMKVLIKKGPPFITIKKLLKCNFYSNQSSALHDDIKVAYIKFKEELAEMAAGRRWIINIFLHNFKFSIFTLRQSYPITNLCNCLIKFKSISKGFI